MKPLVCLTPHSEFEVWELYDYGSEDDVPYWHVIVDFWHGQHPIIYKIDWTDDPPEFWGREVLGEL